LYYRTHCCNSGIELNANDNPSVNKKLIEKLLNDIYNSKEPNKKGLFKSVFREFSRAVKKGLGTNFETVKFNSPDHFILRELTKNVGVFSAFKNHHHVVATVGLLKDKEGNIRPFSSFKEEALKLSDKYNKQWLKTEYDHAISAARSSKKWNDAQRTKHLYPNLMYISVNDDRTRQLHKNWHGLVLPIDHPFWNTHTPPNDHGCRCTFRRSDKPVDTKGVAVEQMPNLPTQFNTNYGKQSKIFDDSHPYFDISKTERIKVIKGFNNYKNEFPEYYKMSGVSISKWADESDLVANYEAAKIILKKNNVNIKIRPHLELDSKNPEYIINSLLGDLKTPESYKNFHKHIDKLKAQCLGVSSKNYYGVFDLNQLLDLDIDKITDILKGKITNRRGRKIEGLYFIYKGKAVLLSRKELVTRDYSKLYKMQ